MQDIDPKPTANRTHDGLTVRTDRHAQAHRRHAGQNVHADATGGALAERRVTRAAMSPISLPSPYMHM